MPQKLWKHTIPLTYNTKTLISNISETYRFSPQMRLIVYPDHKTTLKHMLMVQPCNTIPEFHGPHPLFPTTKQIISPAASGSSYHQLKRHSFRIGAVVGLNGQMNLHII